MTDNALQYPIGRYSFPADPSASWRNAQLEAIAVAPAAMRAALRGLDDTQLDTPYRPGGWTVRQVAHHVPDSHLNAYLRLKLALTEETPTIKPYDEAAWALLEDVRSTPIEVSLVLLESVHDRMLRVMRAMSDEQFARRYRHPESGEHALDYLAGMYAWHGAHHATHVTRLRERMGW